jgi:uncharacterized SAM-binding protein YcdF (DUF218 family)
MMNIVRFILPGIAPLPISLALLVAGLGFLILRRRNAAIICIAFATGLLLVFGYGVYTKQALYRLERSYSPLVVEQITPSIRQQILYVVLLGSGHVSDPDLPKTAQIGGSSLYRLIEGIRIYRHLPGSKLVISGGVIPDPVKNSWVVRDVAQQIGIPVQDMIVEERSTDTIEEAQMLQKLLGDKPFVLVTSAAHMKRALKIFQDFGMRPVPAPTDFILKNSPGKTSESWLPNCDNMLISQRAIYEWLGEIWRLMKKILDGRMMIDPAKK